MSGKTQQIYTETGKSQQIPHTKAVKRTLGLFHWVSLAELAKGLTVAAFSLDVFGILMTRLA